MAGQLADERHPSAPARRLLSVADFHRMAEVGVFDEDDRLELIDGELYSMAPTGPWHENVVDVLQRALQEQLLELKLESLYRLRVQNSIVLSVGTETYPDIAIVREKSEGYGSQKPTAEDTLLVIEVSDSSDDHDRNKKAASYAKAGIPEYWIVSRERGDVTVLTTPTKRGYKSAYVAQDEVVECQAVTGLMIHTRNLF